MLLNCHNGKIHQSCPAKTLSVDVTQKLLSAALRQHLLLGRHKTTHYPLAGTSAALFPLCVTLDDFFLVSVSFSRRALLRLFLDYEVFRMRLPLTASLLCASHTGSQP